MKKKHGLKVVMSKKALVERKMAQRIATWEKAGCYIKENVISIPKEPCHACGNCVYWLRRTQFKLDEWLCVRCHPPTRKEGDTIFISLPN